jgi:hypothetical protein
MEEESIEKLRPMLQSSMDFELLLADPRWGTDEVTQKLRDRLEKTKYFIDNNNNITEVRDQLWSILAFYTKDVRQGYLSENNNEMSYVRHFLILAGDLLSHNYNKSFVIALSRAVSVIETSQSKNGFFTKQKNTLRKEETHTEIEPPKKRFFGGFNKGE